MDELNKQLKDLLASQAELVGSITHDLKGLLSAVEGGIYLVSSGLEKDKKDRVEQGFEMMQRSLGRIRRTVAGSLYYVKDREVDWQTVDVMELTSSVQRELAEHAGHLGVVLETNASAGSFKADQFAIHSLLSNLVEYALEACTIAGLKPSPSIALSASVSGEHAVFEVLVDGFVMEEATREHALGQCYAPKGVDRSHLGIFVAHKLARSHGGTLRIVSLPDEKKTRFVVKIPVTRPADLPDEKDGSIQDQLRREWEGDLE
ncbi:MAG: HAMP domain-containing histidine kinase [Deltaproteobacteria bacterium]|nr:HAMP domain-containing histidine kinase [Deltaproteobacteria bacterium]